MDRPPRAAPPSRFSNTQPNQSSRPSAKRDPSSAVTFQDQVDRNGGGGYAGQGLQSPAGDGKYGDPTSTQYDSYNSLSYQSHADDVGHLESAGGLNPADVRRKKSLVRPDRERIDPNHRQYYYRNHAVQMENDAMGVMPSGGFSFHPGLGVGASAGWGVATGSSFFPLRHLPSLRVKRPRTVHRSERRRTRFRAPLIPSRAERHR